MIKQLFTSPLSRDEIVIIRRCLIVLFAIVLGAIMMSRADAPSVVMVQSPTASESIIKRNLQAPTQDKVPYDTKASLAVALWVAGSAADIASTRSALNRGCEEANPVYGKQPSNGRLILTTVAVTGLFWWAGQYMDNNSRSLMWGIPGAIRGAVAIRNGRLEC